MKIYWHDTDLFDPPEDGETVQVRLEHSVLEGVAFYTTATWSEETGWELKNGTHAKYEQFDAWAYLPEEEE